MQRCNTTPPGSGGNGRPALPSAPNMGVRFSEIRSDGDREKCEADSEERGLVQPELMAAGPPLRRVLDAASQLDTPHCKPLSPIIAPSTSPASVASMLTALAPLSHYSSAPHSPHRTVERERRDAAQDASPEPAQPTGSHALRAHDALAAHVEHAEPELVRPPAPPPAKAAIASVTADVRSMAGRSGDAAGPWAPPSAASPVDVSEVPVAPAAKPRFRTSNEIFFGRPAPFFAGYAVGRRERTWAPLR